MKIFELMDKVLSSVQEYIKSGQYFIDARKWYSFEYVYPVVHKSLLFLFSLIFIPLLLWLLINFDTLLPIVRQVRYAIRSEALKTATIIHANHIKNNPIGSISDVMLKNYIIHRESYDYNLLRPQFLFLQNNSTRIIFRQFANFMNIDNTESPVMRYQKTLRRSVNILSVNYYPNNEAIVQFVSTVKNNTNEVVENIVWEAKINYEIDPISLGLPPNSQFNFTVTNYKLKLIEDRSKK